jgi:GNAT superfamily N-acetyltransferase
MSAGIGAGTHDGAVAGRATVDGVVVGPLDAGHLDAVEPLWRSLIDHLRESDSVVELVPHEQSWPRRRALYQDVLADGHSFALGAWRGERLIAYAVMRVLPPDPVWYTGSHFAELTSLSVAPDERGAGVGTVLLDAVEDGLLTRGIDQYCIGVDTVNDGAQRFYARRGFRDGFHLLHGWIAGRRAVAEPMPGETPETASHGED